MLWFWQTIVIRTLSVQIMRILFATTNPYPPQTAGGSESSTHDLCLSLIGRGIECAVLADQADTAPDGYRADYGMGYPVYRGRDPAKGVKPVYDLFGADVVVIQAGKPLLLIGECLRHGIRAVVYIRNIEFHWHGGGEYVAHPLLSYVANSRFTADTFKKAFGIAAKVIPPLVRTERHIPERHATPDKQKVVFVCPHPLKGVEIALKLAELNPDIPFLFVESWPMVKGVSDKYPSLAAKLPNIEWLPRQLDMKPIYAQARVMLVPSLWQEAWGEGSDRIAGQRHTGPGQQPWRLARIGGLWRGAA
ncbi:MAG: hypothetical protein PHU14_02175 [Methylovulum sp.]|nr:hypothetical protein [Methylovulum sp.]